MNKTKVEKSNTKTRREKQEEKKGEGRKRDLKRETKGGVKKETRKIFNAKAKNEKHNFFEKRGSILCTGKSFSSRQGRSKNMFSLRKRKGWYIKRTQIFNIFRFLVIFF